MKTSREKLQRRAQRVRTKLRKVAEGLPRLSVSRSHKNISVQIIDDEKGITLVIVTHDSELAERCDRLIEMKDGQIVSDKKRGEAK